MRDSRKVVLTMKIFRNVTTVVLTAVMVQSLLATGLAVTTSAYETPKNESTAQTQVQESSAETMFYGGFEYFVSSDNQYIGITKYTGSDEEVVIPSEIDGIPVLYIKQSAFSGNKTLKKVTIPYGVLKIEPYAFWYCENLTSVTIPDSVISIGHSAFNTTALTKVTIPDSVTYLGDDAFAHCSDLSSAVVGNGLDKIPKGTFFKCENLTNVKLGNNITEIYTYSFNYCEKLTNLDLPDSLTVIKSSAFCGSGLRNVSMGNSLETIEDGAFYVTPLEKIFLPDTLVKVEKSAFENSTIKDIYYAGSEQQWQNVSIVDNSYNFVKATMHYNYRNISIDNTELNLTTGQMYTLTARTMPKTDTVTWKSSNTAVATVNKAGRVVARGEGTATVTATAFGGLKVSCTVNVTPQQTLVLDKSELTLAVKEQYTLNPSVSPADDSVTYTFKSNNTNVATVNKSGRIVARGEGTAVITVIASNGLKATCNVNVIPQKTLTLDKTELSFALKEQYTLNPSVSPADDTVTYTFKSDNASVATVNKSGRIVARGEGTAVITVIASNGLKATCNVNVIPQKTLTLDKTELSMEVKEQYVLKPALSPADDTVTYTFKSSNATVASVNSSGRVVARAEGKATVTVRASNGLSAVCEVTVGAVQPPVTQKIVYFNPKNIAVGNERWAVYTWNDNGNQWIDMTKTEDIYQFVLPEDYSNYIIVRMNGATTENNWNNKWNQSPDLVYSDTINLIIATGWGSNGIFTVSQAIKA